MRPGRLFAAICKALLLIVLLVGIFYFLRVRQQQDVIDDAADDLKEQVGDTYVPVHVTTITKKTMHRFITAYGRVEPSPESEKEPAASASISAPIAAMVASVDCFEGQTVRKGQKLFTLDDRAAQENLRSDEVALEAASSRRDTLKADPSTAGWLLMQADRDVDLATLTLRRDQAQLAGLTIASPIEGTVTRVKITPGSVSEPSQTALELVNQHRLVIAVDVTSAALAEIKLGDEAFGTFGKSTVIRIDTAVNPQTGLGSVDISLPADTALRPGQSFSAQIAVETQTDSLVVPASSIVMDASDRPTIALIDDSGRWAVRTVVQRGIADGDDVAISGDAVHAGDSVVTIGAYGLTDRTRVALLKD